MLAIINKPTPIPTAGVTSFLVTVVEDQTQMTRLYVSMDRSKLFNSYLRFQINDNLIQSSRMNWLSGWL